MPNSAVQQTPPMTVDDFLSFLDSKPEPENQKWELHDGVPKLMTGGIAAHAMIAGNIDRALFGQARDRGGEVMRGFFAQASRHAAFEPDVVVWCGPTRLRSRAATDPVAIF